MRGKPKFKDWDEENNVRIKTWAPLLTTENIFLALPGLEEQLLARLGPSSTTRIVIDHATADYALSALAMGDSAWWEPLLPTRTDVYAAAVYQLLDAIVLYEEIVVGPGGIETLYMRPDVAAVQKLLSGGNNLFSDTKLLLGLINIARHAAVNEIDSNKEVREALSTLGATHGQVRKRVLTMSPAFASHSAHYYDGLSKSQEEEFCLSNLVHGALGQNRIALDAIDPANRGKHCSTENYFTFLAKRPSMAFPREGCEDFLAAALLMRTIMYLMVSELVGGTYQGDAIRAPLVKALLSNRPEAARAFVKVVSDALEKQNREKRAALNAALGYKAFQMPAPPVAEYILKKAERIEDVLTIALDLRESKAARKFRLYCQDVDAAIGDGDVRKVENALAAVSAQGVKLIGSRDTSAKKPLLDVVKELATHSSFIVKVIWPLLTLPLEKLHDKIRYRRLALLQRVQSTAGFTSAAERELRRLVPRLPTP
jgi:chloramphenicol 3-O-phosphotransferase